MQMSKNRNRQRLKKVEDGRSYRLICLNHEFPLYWDEGWTSYPIYRKGFKNPNKRIFQYERRVYRTWKYNRKTKWK